MTKNIVKKLITILMIFVMVLTIAPIKADAKTYNPTGTYQYGKGSKKITVEMQKATSKKGMVIIIPSMKYKVEAMDGYYKKVGANKYKFKKMTITVYKNKIKIKGGKKFLNKTYKLKTRSVT